MEIIIKNNINVIYHNINNNDIDGNKDNNDNDYKNDSNDDKLTERYEKKYVHDFGSISYKTRNSHLLHAIN